MIILLAIILLIGSVCNFFCESNAYRRGSFHFGLQYISLVIIGAAGYIGWRKEQPAAMAKIWVTSYAIVLFVSIVARLISAFSFMPSIVIQSIAIKLRALCLTPLPFMTSYILIKFIPVKNS